ncbi:MAG TPA: DinB family protein [Vicinamibacterales bacterium]|nr:DinB family protein [Vicinamibacterales bacterium]
MDLSDVISRGLSWHDAHVDFDGAVAGLPAGLRGQRPAGMPHSPWQIVEHLRIAQHDILDFCRNPHYAEMQWPADYWPADPAPPSAAAWEASLAALHRDRRALQDLATDPKLDLFAAIPHGSGQTYLRELLLVIDHNAYHVGELVTIRRMLGAWPA